MTSNTTPSTTTSSLAPTYEQLVELCANQEKINEELKVRLESLENDNKLLRKALLKSNRPVNSRFDDSNSDQLFLFEGPASPLAAEEERPTKEKKKKKTNGGGRKRLPPNLPRRRVEKKAEQQNCSCCNKKLSHIRWETSEHLEYTPAKLWVTELYREVLGCSCKKGSLVTAPVEPSVIPKSYATATLLTFILVSKFMNHTPLHRLEKTFRHEGVPIPQSTMCDWVRATTDALAPIVVALKQYLLNQPFLQVDETVGKARDPSIKGSLKTIYFLVCGVPDQEVVFEYATGRSAKFTSGFIQGFKGEALQMDEYSGYNQYFRENPDVMRAGCWSHAIRKFKDAIEEADRAIEAHAISSIIKRLETLESQMRERKYLPHERLRVRKRIHAASLQRIREQFDRDLLDPSILPKSTYGQALSYASNHWKTLSACLRNGRVELSNNWIERQIKLVALGRKNWLHIGSVDAGERTAIMYSLIGSCDRLGINPREYLTDVLNRIPTHPAEQALELAPRQWLAAKEEKGTQD